MNASPIHGSDWNSCTSWCTCIQYKYDFSNTDGTETRDVCRGYKWYVGCIADWSVLVNCMHQSTNFPGQLDRASATFPLIMHYAVFHHLFLWVVQGSRTVFKTRQFKRLNNASNKKYFMSFLFIIVYSHARFNISIFLIQVTLCVLYQGKQYHLKITGAIK